MINKEEIQQVKELGDRIGYGHLMSLTGALWRADLKSKQYPRRAAFVPTLMDFIKSRYREIAEKDARNYDTWIKEHLE